MSLLLYAPTRNTAYWAQRIREIDPSLTVYEHPDEVPDPEQITCAATWQHLAGALQAYPNLRLLCSMGAGADHFMRDPELPQGVPITRIVDPKLAVSMSNFILMAVLNHHRRFVHFYEQQEQARWAQKDECELPLRIGVLGLGVLGQDAAQKLAQLGFYVAGHSQSRKQVPEVKSYAGAAELPEFLQDINVLICTLPLTPDTEGMLNADLFARCQPGTFLINVARGAHLVEEDLIPAVEAGHLSGACLDVFRKEPLPEDHPFWSHPKVWVFPHHASLTNPDAAIPQIVENYQRMQAGKPLQNEVDRNKGY